MKKNLLALSLWVAVAVPASADGLYVFGDAGRSSYAIDSEAWDSSASATSFSFGVAYGVNNTFSFEADYRHIGKFTLIETEYEKITSDSSAIEMSVVAKYPFSTEINIYGRLGVAKLTNDADILSFKSSESSNKVFYGIGAGYVMSEHVSLRTEYQRYEEWNGVTISNITLGAAYSF
jgi:hypothetical protein